MKRHLYTVRGPRDAIRVAYAWNSARRGMAEIAREECRSRGWQEGAAVSASVIEKADKWTHTSGEFTWSSLAGRGSFTITIRRAP